MLKKKKKLLLEGEYLPVLLPTEGQNWLCRKEKEGSKGGKHGFQQKHIPCQSEGYSQYSITLCIGFFWTSDITSVKSEVSPLYTAVIHALRHAFLTRHRQRNQLHMKKFIQTFDWYFEGISGVFFQEAFPSSWRQTQKILWRNIKSTLLSIERLPHTKFSLCLRKDLN